MKALFWVGKPLCVLEVAVAAARSQYRRHRERAMVLSSDIEAGTTEQVMALSSD